jgi:hypothetical protein
MRFAMISVALLAVLAPACAQAATCEESFVKKGSVLSKQSFSAETTIADVSPQIALNQVRGIALTQGLTIVVDEAVAGSMLIEKPSTFGQRTVQFLVSAVPVGRATTVRITTQLSLGDTMKAASMKAQLCGLLSPIQGGKAGVVAAKSGKSAVATPQMRVVDAVTLSQQLSEEGEANAVAVSERYRGQIYTIKGRFSRISNIRGVYRVYYDVPRSTNDLFFKPSKFRFLTQISCAMAPGQTAYALTLQPGSKIALTGTFQSYQHLQHMTSFDNCRPG